MNRALYEYRERFAIQLISRVPCYRERGRQEAWRVIATSASVPRPPSWSGTAAACDNREVHQLIYCWRHQSSDSGKCVKVGEISAVRLIFSGKNFNTFSVCVQEKCWMNSTKRRIVLLQLQIMKCKNKWYNKSVNWHWALLNYLGVITNDYLFVREWLITKHK